MAACSILEGVGGDLEVSLHCDDVLLIESVGGLARGRVQIANWFPVHLPPRTFRHEPLWLSCWTRCAQRMCEVDSDGTLDKERQFRIDVTIKSVFFPPATVGAGYLFRHSRRLLQFSLERDGAQCAVRHAKDRERGSSSVAVRQFSFCSVILEDTPHRSAKEWWRMAHPSSSDGDDGSSQRAWTGSLMRSSWKWAS